MHTLKIILIGFIIYIVIIGLMLRWLHLNVWHGDERDDRHSNDKPQ